MSQASTSNQRIVLASRPHGAPTADNFRLEHVTLPDTGAGADPAQDAVFVLGPLHARANE